MRVLLVLCCLACGSGDDDGPPPSDGSSDAVSTDGRADAPPTGDAPRGDGPSCASMTVYPCCGGALPPCVGEVDGGGCPEGTSIGQCFTAGGFDYDCTYVCTPDPPYCAPAGADCATECGGGGQVDQDGTCHCLCA